MKHPCSLCKIRMQMTNTGTFLSLLLDGLSFSSLLFLCVPTSGRFLAKSQNTNFGSFPLLFPSFLSFFFLSHLCCKSFLFSVFGFSPFRRSTTSSTFIAIVCTFIPVFDVPVYWPILLVYFLFLSFATLKQRINHMVQHRYVPWSREKRVYKAPAVRI